ncbi:Response regulator protein with GGDEF domain [Thiocapsa sp. KS1]|nr:GGDEF domain-containing protein [Thiocapsa sp. KS1]CRI65798.1 Response regulator protein with GGDEF domain [Thiocapsa sp. KS1]
MKKTDVAVPDPIELRGFNRTLAEIEWLLLVLVLVYLVLPEEPIEQTLGIAAAVAVFAVFILGFRYLNLFTLPARWKLTIETWAMLVFTAFVVWHTGKVDSPLISLFLLVIVFSALTLGKLITLLEVALIASFYLLAAYTVAGTELFAYSTFSRLMLLFAPVALVAYVTSLIASDMSFSRTFVQRLSETDELTGLPNMRAFSVALDRHRDSAVMRDRPFGLMMVDADNLKEVNDRYGHSVGNQVIRAVADGIRRSIRSADLVARYGGDEFILLLPETTEQAAHEAGERIRMMVASTLIDTGKDAVTTTVSIGYATYPSMATEVDDLMSRADEALYASKRAGRNRVFAFSEISGNQAGPAHP